MFEQDYIMRLIKEMVRMFLKLLFNIDTNMPAADLITDKEVKSVLDELLEMTDHRQINEAENKLWDMADGADRRYLEIGLLFYLYLNEKDDDFLFSASFCREEIQNGLKELVSRYGLSDMAEIFFMREWKVKNKWERMDMK